MAKHANSFDFILNTVSASHDLNPFISLLKLDGTMVLVGAPDHPLPVARFRPASGGAAARRLGIGGIAETQEMLDFCGEHGIVSDIEMIRIERSTRPTSGC